MHLRGYKNLHWDIWPVITGATVRPKGLNSSAQPHSGDARIFYTKVSKMERGGKKITSKTPPLRLNLLMDWLDPKWKQRLNA